MDLRVLFVFTFGKLSFLSELAFVLGERKLS